MVSTHNLVSAMISIDSPHLPDHQQLLVEDPQKSIITSSEPEVDGDHVFRSKLPDILISNNMPLHTYCFERVADFADQTCLVVGSTGKAYSYSETHLLCKRAAAGLAKIGIGKGDVVMILLQNCAEFVFTFFGASMLGAVTTTANPFYTPPEIYKQLVASGAKLIVTQSQYVDKLKDNNVQAAVEEQLLLPQIHQDFKVVTVDDPPDNKCLPFSLLAEAANEAEIPEVVIDADDPVALPFSSGTTGLPKGVILTHRSLITSVAQQVDGDNPNLYLTRSDMVLCVLPLFHIYSLNSVLLCSLRAGSGVLLMHKFEIGTLIRERDFHPIIPTIIPH
uniref:AMP-dependent synthetase/ligase domain-containing protein n=1 Tax=Kalanchoe fedtschenkoi TaxID=63787 RepID=A0A7N0VC29_KALFE